MTRQDGAPTVKEGFAAPQRAASAAADNHGAAEDHIHARSEHDEPSATDNHTNHDDEPAPIEPPATPHNDPPDKPDLTAPRNPNNHAHADADIAAPCDDHDQAHQHAQSPAGAQHPPHESAPEPPPPPPPITLSRDDFGPPPLEGLPRDILRVLYETGARKPPPRPEPRGMSHKYITD